MSAREAAISDIKSELHKEGKVFLAYRVELNLTIKDITKEYLSMQESLKK